MVVVHDLLPELQLGRGHHGPRAVLVLVVAEEVQDLPTERRRRLHLLRGRSRDVEVHYHPVLRAIVLDVGHGGRTVERRLVRQNHQHELLLGADQRRERRRVGRVAQNGGGDVTHDSIPFLAQQLNLLLLR